MKKTQKVNKKPFTHPDVFTLQGWQGRSNPRPEYGQDATSDCEANFKIPDVPKPSTGVEVVNDWAGEVRLGVGGYYKLWLDKKYISVAFVHSERAIRSTTMIWLANTKPCLLIEHP